MKSEYTSANKYIPGGLKSFYDKRDDSRQNKHRN